MVQYSQSPILRRTKKFFEFLSIVQLSLSIAFFGSWLVLLINYAIGPSTLNGDAASLHITSGYS